ncbi:MAG: tetratricopeptide repeat protein, partial [Candidatus Zixiibacteriota bacterium]
YYRNTGDTLNEQIESDKWFSDYPETYVRFKVDSLAYAGMVHEAINYGQQMILKNPMYSASYFAVGLEYLVARNPDSAIQYLEIANVMSPDIPDYIYFLGLAYAEKGDIDKAEDEFNNYMSINDSLIDPYLVLLKLYKDGESNEKYYSLLAKVAQREDAPNNILIEYGVYLINTGEEKRGQDYLKKAISNGLDSTSIQQLIKKYPQLQF